MDRETPMESCVGHEVVNGVCLSGVLSGTRHSHHQGGPNRVLSRTWNGQYGPNGVLSVSWHGQKDLSGVLCRTCHSQWAPSGRAATTYGKKNLQIHPKYQTCKGWWVWLPTKGRNREDGEEGRGVLLPAPYGHPCAEAASSNQGLVAASLKAKHTLNKISQFTLNN